MLEALDYIKVFENEELPAILLDETEVDLKM
jgi:hypothetical protein